MYVEIRKEFIIMSKQLSLGNQAKQINDMTDKISDNKDLNARELKEEFNKKLDKNPIMNVGKFVNPVAYAGTKVVTEAAFKSLETYDKNLVKNEDAILERIKSGKELNALDEPKKEPKSKTVNHVKEISSKINDSVNQMKSNSKSYGQRAEEKFGDIVGKLNSEKEMEL